MPSSPKHALASRRYLSFDTYLQRVPDRESGEPIEESGEVYRITNPFAE